MIKFTEATYNKWRDGWLVVTGMRGGERVALSNSARIKWRVREGTIIENDREVSLSCVMSGIDARLELHDDEKGFIYARSDDFGPGNGTGFFMGSRLDVEASPPSTSAS